MCTPTLYGVAATPMAIADEKGNHAIINTVSNRWTETFARTLTVDMGCSAMIALYAMTGKQVKESCVTGTISFIGADRARRSGGPGRRTSIRSPPCWRPRTAT